MLNYFKFLSPSFVKSHLRKLKYERNFKDKNLIVGLGCGLHNVSFGKNVFLGTNVQLNNTFIDDFSYVNENTSISFASIGKYCSIASDVKISLGKHPTDFVSLHPTFYANNKGFKTFSDKTYIDEWGKVEIGNDVWIGSDVKIPGDIKIGDGAVIAAGAVVTKDVEPYTVVGGVPAKLLKYRFDRNIIDKLLIIKWWDLEEKLLKENFLLFHDINKFIKYFDE